MALGNTIYMAGLVISISIRVAFILKKRNTRVNVDRKSLVDILMLILVICAVVIVPLCYIFSPWLKFADYNLPLWATGCGIVLLILSLWVFWRSHADLDKNWHVSLELKNNHRLVTDGIYKNIRHPMYASFALWSLAQCLLLHNFVAGFSTLIIDGIMYFIRVPKEEQMMLDQFKEEYREYMQRTWRLFPKLF